jgi:hypothetical protein
MADGWLLKMEFDRNFVSLPAREPRYFSNPSAEIASRIPENNAVLPGERIDSSCNRV